MYINGAPDTPWLHTAADVDRLIEECFAQGAEAALLYAANLPPRFFDLSSGEAGAIVQKLRNYRIRLAVVYDPQRVTLSRRFPDLLAEERRDVFFGLFESAEAAGAWLAAHSQEGRP